MTGKRQFADIAPYYDTLMQGIEYKEWVGYTVELFERFGYNPRSILDLACGTGSASLELARRGYQVTAMDASARMLEVFKNKKGAEEVEIIKGDMRKFRLKQPVDAVTCYFDSVNYLLRERDLEKCFKRVFDTLGEKGIFIFDMNTIYGLERVWGTNTLIREVENIYSVWKSVYDSSRHLSTLYLTMFISNGDCYRRLGETHQERAYPLPTVKELLVRAGFNKVEIFAHMTTQVFLDISSRVMIIAEKKEEA